LKLKVSARALKTLLRYKAMESGEILTKKQKKQAKKVARAKEKKA
jgi:hypothetical protein